MSTLGRPRSMRSHTQTQYVTHTPVNDAMRECIQIALASKNPAAAVYEYVHDLIQERRLAEAEANEVGSRAIGVLNASSLPPYDL